MRISFVFKCLKFDGLSEMADKTKKMFFVFKIIAFE